MAATTQAQGLRIGPEDAIRRLESGEPVLVLEGVCQGTTHTRVSVEDLTPLVDERVLLGLTHCGRNHSMRLHLMRSQLMHLHSMQTHVL